MCCPAAKTSDPDRPLNLSRSARAILRLNTPIRLFNESRQPCRIHTQVALKLSLVSNRQCLVRSQAMQQVLRSGILGIRFWNRRQYLSRAGILAALRIGVTKQILNGSLGV
jgi:hypothetical protein